MTSRHAGSHPVDTGTGPGGGNSGGPPSGGGRIGIVPPGVVGGGRIGIEGAVVLVGVLGVVTGPVEESL